MPSRALPEVVASAAPATRRGVSGHDRNGATSVLKEVDKPTALTIAQGLLANCLDLADRSEGVAEGVAATLGRLCRHLSEVLGEDGMAALYGQALNAARKEHPALSRPAGAAARTPWEVLATDLGALGPEAALAAGTALLAILLQSLARFIGGPLTVRLLQDLWPRALLPLHGWEKS